MNIVSIALEKNDQLPGRDVYVCAWMFRFDNHHVDLSRQVVCDDQVSSIKSLVIITKPTA